MKVSLLASEDTAAWDEFVLATQKGTFFHLACWQSVIQRAFGHRTFYLMARRGGHIEGVLPLTQMKSAFFGNRLISNAFCTQGGILSVSADATDALAAEAIRIGRELNADCIEFRSFEELPEPWRQRSGIYSYFRGPIYDGNLRSLPRGQRRRVQRAIDSGARSVVDNDVEKLFQLYASSVRRLGTPVFSRRLFEILKDVFKNDCEILTVTRGSEPLASVMSFYFRNEVLPYYTGSNEDARESGANQLMYWEVMRRARERGCDIFDFGRSKVGTGPHEFKEHWGFTPLPVAYNFYLLRANEIPDVNPLNPRYQTAILIWKRLPLRVTKLIGPLISRSLG